MTKWFGTIELASKHRDQVTQFILNIRRRSHSEGRFGAKLPKFFYLLILP